MISQPLFPVGKSPVFAGLFESRHGHHAESIVTRAGHIRVSIVNAAQGYIFTSKSPAADASEAQASAQAADDTTGTVVEQVGVPGKPVKGLLGSDPYDELSLGKKYFRTSNYGLAEKHFRAAVEKHPRDAEAWIGLAASYDRLRRFDLATAPMVRRSASLDRPSRFSTIRASRTCCVVTTNARSRLHSARIPA